MHEGRGSADLDAEVAQRIFGWTLCQNDGSMDWVRSWRSSRGTALEGEWICLDGPYADQVCPSFSGSIAAAWLVVEHIMRHANQPAFEAFKRGVEDADWCTHSSIAAARICRAALAVIEQHSGTTWKAVTDPELP
jgi:hypothetical protein